MNEKKGLAITSLIFGLLSSVWIFFGLEGLIFPLLGIVFGIVAVVADNKLSIAVAGLISSFIMPFLSIIIIALLLGSLSNGKKVFNSAINNVSVSDILSEPTVDDTQQILDDMTGENTDELLGTEVAVDIGVFQVVENEYGFETTTLPIRITNLSGDIASYTITIEATNPDGSRLELAYAFANELNSGQSYDTEVFQSRTNEIESFQNANFSVFQIQKY